MPEQRRDGEPVGDPADHRRLGRGPDVGQPRVVWLQHEATGEDGRHHRQKAGGGPLHPVEAALALFRVGRWLQGRVTLERGRGRGLGFHVHQSSAGPDPATPPT